MKSRNMLSLKIAGILLATILLAFSSCEIIEELLNPYNAELVFEQIDFDLGGEIITNSSWGSATLTYTGSRDVLYFNLAVNDSWVIQNIPILSPKGEGIIQSLTLRFDLGVSSGTEVLTLEYAFNLNTDTLETTPRVVQTSSVRDGNIIFYPGFSDEDVSLDPPTILVGGAAIRYAYHEGDFPNQECGINECTPVAVSNSLQFLNDEYGLGFTDDQMSIATMKMATEWTPNGCLIYDWNDQLAWWKVKDQYMEDNDYPITTRMITDFDQIIDEIEAGQDVEVTLAAHTAAVVSILKIGGKYVINIAHDSEQGEAGGTITEMIIYNTSTGKFEGGAWINNKSFHYFAVECPEE